VRVIAVDGAGGRADARVHCRGRFRHLVGAGRGPSGNQRDSHLNVAAIDLGRRHRRDVMVLRPWSARVKSDDYERATVTSGGRWRRWRAKHHQTGPGI
jgi:hypothetical protein